MSFNARERLRNQFRNDVQFHRDGSADVTKTHGRYWIPTGNEEQSVVSTIKNILPNAEIVESRSLYGRGNGFMVRFRDDALKAPDRSSHESPADRAKTEEA